MGFRCRERMKEMRIEGRGAMGEKWESERGEGGEGGGGGFRNLMVAVAYTLDSSHGLKCRMYCFCKARIRYKTFQNKGNGLS